MTVNKDNIAADMKAAMKSGDKIELSTLRLLLSEIKYAEIKKGEALTEDELIAVVGREIKKRREAIPLYRQGGREDLAAKEEAETAILQGYLPQQLSEAAIAGLVDAAIAQAGATGLKDLGKVMTALMPKVRGRADGTVVSQTVKAKLAEGARGHDTNSATTEN